MTIDHTGSRLLGHLLWASDDRRSLPGIPGSFGGEPSSQPKDPLWGGQPSQPPAPSANPAPQQPPPPGQAPAPYTPPPAYQVPQPQQLSGTFVLSGWGRRAGAQLVDWMVVFGILIVVSIVIGALVGDTTTGDSSEDFNGVATIVGVMFLVLVASTLYAPAWMAATNGSTLGKKIFGIRVVRVTGEKVGFGYAFTREVLVKGFLFGVLGVWFFFFPWLLNYLWPLWDSEHRAGHDFVVRSRVVLDR